MLAILTHPLFLSGLVHTVTALLTVLGFETPVDHAPNRPSCSQHDFANIPERNLTVPCIRSAKRLSKQVSQGYLALSIHYPENIPTQASMSPLSSPQIKAMDITEEQKAVLELHSNFAKFWIMNDKKISYLHWSNYLTSALYTRFYTNNKSGFKHLNLSNLTNAQFRQGANEIVRLRETVKTAYDDFERVYKEGKSPKWLDRLNYVRQQIHEEWLSKNDPNQSRLMDYFLNKQGNALVHTLLMIGVFQDNKWADDLPPHRLGVRLYNDFIEPVLLIEPNEEFPKGLDLNLANGDTRFPEDTPANIYDWRITHWALVNYFNQWDKNLKIEKSEFLIRESTRTPQHNGFWVWWNLEYEDIQGVFKGTPLHFGPEPYNYAKDIPVEPELPFKKLSHKPNTIDKKSADIGEGELPPDGEGGGEGQSNGDGPSEANPDEAEGDLADETKKEVEMALMAALGAQAMGMSDDEQLEATQDMTEAAAKMAEMQGMDELAAELASMDKELIEKLMSESTEGLSAEELEQMESLKEAAQMIRMLKSKKPGSPDYAAPPFIRLATEDELENEFSENIPFLIKFPPPEELYKRDQQSQTKVVLENAPDYFWQVPQKDIVVRTEEEVALLASMKYRQPIFKHLRKQVEDSIDRLFEKYELNRVGSFLMYKIDPEKPKVSIKKSEAPEVLKALDEVRRIVHNTNDLMKYVFFDSEYYQPYPEENEEEKQTELLSSTSADPGDPTAESDNEDPGDENNFLYFNYPPLKSLYEAVLHTHEWVLQDPKAFIEIINRMGSSQSTLWLKLHQQLSRWLPIFKASLDNPPSAQVAESMGRIWPELENYWAGRVVRELQLDPSKLFKEQLYNLNMTGSSKIDKQDVYKPLLPLLPLLLSPKLVQLAQSDFFEIDCRKRVPFINLPPGAGADFIAYSEKLIDEETYFKNIQSKNPRKLAELEMVIQHLEDSDRIEKCVHELHKTDHDGRQIDLEPMVVYTSWEYNSILQKLSMTEYEKLKGKNEEKYEADQEDKPIIISPTIFLLLVLSSPDDVLGHPLTQAAVWGLADRALVEKIDQLLDFSTADSLLALTQLGPWFRSSDTAFRLNPEIESQFSLGDYMNNDLKDEKLVNIHFARNEDWLQRMNHQPRMVSPRQILPENVAQLILKSVEIKYSHLFEKIRLEETNPMASDNFSSVSAKKRQWLKEHRFRLRRRPVTKRISSPLSVHFPHHLMTYESTPVGYYGQDIRVTSINSCSKLHNFEFLSDSAHLSDSEIFVKHSFNTDSIEEACKWELEKLRLPPETSVRPELSPSQEPAEAQGLNTLEDGTQGTTNFAPPPTPDNSGNSNAPSFSTESN